MSEAVPGGKRGPGRPRKEQLDPKNPVIGFRARKWLLTKLKAEAGDRGMSVSEVIERRLAESYARDDLAGDMRIRALGDAVVTTAIAEQARIKRPWFHSDNDARFTLARIVSMLRNLMNVPVPSDIEDEEQRGIAKLLDHLGAKKDQQYASYGGVIPKVYTEIRDLDALWMLRHRIENAEDLIAEAAVKDNAAREEIEGN